MTRLSLVGFLVLALVALRPAVAQEPGESSLTGWLDAFARQLEGVPDGPRAGLSIQWVAGRGVEERRVERVVRPHLVRRLERGAVVGPLNDDGDSAMVITVSLEGDRVWAVGVLRSGGLAGPVAVAQDWPVDRELEALLGLRPARPGQGRWSMERLGTLPLGVLDLLLQDLDGDGRDDIVLLGVDGVRTYLWSPLEERPSLDQGPLPLPRAPWPRALEGWLAWDGAAVRVATTAGHRMRWPIDGRALLPDEEDGVPLSQAYDPSRAPLLLGRLGSGVDLTVPSTPQSGPLRDVAQWPGRDDVWLWVDAAGVLGGAGSAGPPTFRERRVGDRLLLADLDANAGPELVTSEAALPGSPDRVRIEAVSPRLDVLTVLFEGSLDGAVRAMAAGDVDFDGRGDLLLVEETAGAPVLWIVRRR